MRSRDLGRFARIAVATCAAAVLLASASPSAAIGRDANLPVMRKLTWVRGGGSAGAAPEIDPGTLRGAIALVAGGLAILRDRRRR
ncbi:hypothetical protein KGQ64_15535 [bacterium]|nr:hypothetical protein [bacterium]